MGVSQGAINPLATILPIISPIKIVVRGTPHFQAHPHCLDKSESACNKHRSYLFLTQDESQFQCMLAKRRSQSFMLTNLQSRRA